MKLQETEDSTWLKRRKINEVMVAQLSYLAGSSTDDRIGGPEGESFECHDAVNFRCYVMLWLYCKTEGMGGEGHLFPNPRNSHW